MRAKFMFLIMVVVIISGLISVASAEISTILPDAIKIFFDKPAFEDMTILSTAVMDNSESEHYYFVLLRKEQNKNALYVFTKKNGDWKFSYSNSSAVPQTSHTMEVGIAYSGEEYPTFERFNKPHLSILQNDLGDEYPELCITFELSNGKWLLHRVWSYTDYASMLIKDNSISYYEDIESQSIIGTVVGAFQRDLKYFTLSALPKTLEEAKKSITSAPIIPQGDFQAKEIKFSGGKKFSVYSAPDKHSLRGAKGKAVVSTNGWIQVFGQENDWILIQYSIDSKHYRFGYIGASALPKGAEIQVLNFADKEAWSTDSVALTDDSLFSCNELLTLPSNASVTWLATMEDWAYIEYSNTTDKILVRGFVKTNELKLLSDDQAKAIALQTLYAALPIYDFELKEDSLINCLNNVSYDSYSGLWTIVFSLDAEHQFEVSVDDKTGSSWVSDLDHG